MYFRNIENWHEKGYIHLDALHIAYSTLNAYWMIVRITLQPKFHDFECNRLFSLCLSVVFFSWIEEARITKSFTELKKKFALKCLCILRSSLLETPLDCIQIKYCWVYYLCWALGAGRCWFMVVACDAFHNSTNSDPNTGNIFTMFFVQFKPIFFLLFVRTHYKHIPKSRVFQFPVYLYCIKFDNRQTHNEQRIGCLFIFHINSIFTRYKSPSSYFESICVAFCLNKLVWHRIDMANVIATKMKMMKREREYKITIYITFDF